MPNGPHAPFSLIPVETVDAIVTEMGDDPLTLNNLRSVNRFFRTLIESKKLSGSWRRKARDIRKFLGVIAHRRQGRINSMLADHWKAMPPHTLSGCGENLREYFVDASLRAQGDNFRAGAHTLIQNGLNDLSSTQQDTLLSSMRKKFVDEGITAKDLRLIKAVADGAVNTRQRDFLIDLAKARLTGMNQAQALEHLGNNGFLHSFSPNSHAQDRSDLFALMGKEGPNLPKRPLDESARIMRGFAAGSFDNFTPTEREQFFNAMYPMNDAQRAVVTGGIARHGLAALGTEERKLCVEDGTDPMLILGILRTDFQKMNAAQRALWVVRATALEQSYLPQAYRAMAPYFTELQEDSRQALLAKANILPQALNRIYAALTDVKEKQFDPLITETAKSLRGNSSPLRAISGLAQNGLARKIAMDMATTPDGGSETRRTELLAAIAEGSQKRTPVSDRNLKKVIRAADALSWKAGRSVRRALHETFSIARLRELDIAPFSPISHSAPAAQPGDTSQEAPPTQHDLSHMISR